MLEVKAGGRLVSAELREFIDRRVNALQVAPARLAVRESLYQLAVDLRAAGFQENYVEQRLGEIWNAFLGFYPEVSA